MARRTLRREVEEKTPAKPRLGHCLGVRLDPALRGKVNAATPCPCEAFDVKRAKDVHGWKTCPCGHSQQAHALVEEAAA